MPNQPITVEKALAMMSEYRTYMTAHGVDINNQTQTISFDAAILAQWINEVLPNMDELRVCLGVYPSNEANAGRITVALWPYRNGAPATSDTARGVAAEIEPFNVGSLEP